MNTLRSYSFPKDGFDVFCRDLINHFRLLKDGNDKLIFRRDSLVGMGIGHGEEPTPMNVPALRIWADTEQWRIGSTSHFFIQDSFIDLSLYVYYSDFTKDKNGNWIDSATGKHGLCKYIVNSLEQPEQPNVAGALYPRNGQYENSIFPDGYDGTKFIWDFTDQTVTIEHRLFAP